MSQCSRVLDVLREGGWKSIQEIHDRAGTMRLNSRISDLRLKHGCNIEYRIVKGLHSYRLLDEPSGFSSSANTGGSSSGTVRAEGYSERADGGPLLGSLPLAVRKGHAAGSVVASSPEEPQTQPIRQPTLWEAA